MEQIRSILGVTFPFYALVLCGYLATRRRLLPLEAIPGLSSYVLYFALSAMLFRFGAATPLERILDGRLIVLYAASAFLIIGIVVAATRNTRIGLRDAAFGAMSSVYSNSGFMGIPLLLALLGEHAVGVAIVTIMVDQVIVSSLCLSIAHAQGRGVIGAGGEAVLRGVFGSLRGAASNPMLWAVLVGVGGGALGLNLPGPLDRTVALLSDSASPVALFTIGAILGRNVLDRRSRSPLIDYVPLALVKLFVHPAVVFLGCLAARALGFPLDAPTITAVILIAALPSASNVTMLAERFGGNAGRIASTIMVSTTVSFVTFSSLVWLLGIRPL